VDSTPALFPNGWELSSQESIQANMGRDFPTRNGIAAGNHTPNRLKVASTTSTTPTTPTKNKNVANFSVTAKSRNIAAYYMSRCDTRPIF
jgi:hypothetical protein